ncbi:MAG: LacI family DNA-binding transcriptional regulator [Caldilineaceae bacterium]|nr:LacI family DNA-binding transcriptional regulator [Caldilineaceae bacterium]
MGVNKRIDTRRKNITMRDVAQRAGVSQSTVSRVLSGASEPIPIGAETQQRVLDAVAELGYQPNLHAGSLRGQKTRMIAVMIADIVNPFYHGIIRTIQDRANREGYDTMIANSDHVADEELRFVNSIIRRPVDGAILIPYHLTDDDLDGLIERTGVQLAVLGQNTFHPAVDVVFSKDGEETRKAIIWLHEEKLHTAIGFIGVSDLNHAGARRRRAYREVMQSRSLLIPAGFEQEGDWTYVGGHRAMQRLLSLPARPTAVFACNDLMAIGALHAINEAGLRVPDDIALVGFDDIPAAAWVQPRLTTIAQQPGAIGQCLAGALFQRINGGYEGPGRHFEIRSQFVERESA